MSDAGDPSKRIERELLLRTRLTHLAEPGLAPLVAGFAEEVTFLPGSVIFQAGDPAAHFYAFVRGEIELSATGMPPWILRSQSGIGLLDVLADRPRTFTARAATRVKAMRVGAGDYLDFIEEHFELVVSAVVGVTEDVHRMSLALAPDGGFPELPAPGRESAPPEVPLDLVEKLVVLRDAAPFRRANVQSLVRLAALAKERRVRAGEDLFRRGEAAGKFFLVARGVIEARHEAPEVRARFGRADLVCGYGALGRADNSYAARALSDALVLAFAEEDFVDVMEEHFELTRSVLAGMAVEYERLLLERERRAARA